MVTKDETKREEELKCRETHDKREAPLGGLHGQRRRKGQAGERPLADGHQPAPSAAAGWGRGDATACPPNSGRGGW